jgi:hypothetical protein
MNATILSIFAKPARRVPAPRNWTTQEVAELYRVCEHLAQAGIRVVIDTGLSDEGEPWAVFEQCETGDVVVHIARIDGQLIVSNGVSGEVYRGANFRSLTDQMLEGAPLAMPRFGAGSNVVMHPRVVLTAFVAATVVLAELARGTGAAEAREAPTKAEEGLSNGSLVDVLSRLLSRDQAQMTASAQSGSMAVAIGLAGAAAYAAQLAADEVRGASESGGAISGWLEFLLSDSKDLGRMGDPSPVEPIDADSAPAVLAAKVEGHEDGATEGEAQVRLFHVTLEDIADVRSVITEFEAAPRAKADVNARAPVLPEAGEATVAVADKIAKAEGEAKTAGKSETRGETRNAEYHTKVVLKVEAAFLTLDAQALGFSDAFASTGIAGAIVVKKSAGVPGPADTAVIVLGEPTAAKSMAPLPDTSYKPASAASQTLHLGPGEDVVVYMGGQIEVFGFVFGQDRIAFVENVRDANWLADVKIVGTDVVLSGHDGGSITLRDAATIVA